MTIPYTTIEPLVCMLFRHPDRQPVQDLRARYADDATPVGVRVMAEAVLRHADDTGRTLTKLTEQEIAAIEAEDDDNLTLFEKLYEASALSSSGQLEGSISKLISIAPSVSHAELHLQMVFWWQLGVLYFRLRLIDESKSAFLQARDLATTLGNATYVALLSSELATVHLDSGDPVKALGGFEHSYKLLSDAGKTAHAQKALLNIATASHRLGKIDDAVKVYESVLAQLHNDADDQVRHAVMYNLATAYQSLSQNDRAAELFNSIARITSKANAMDFHCRAVMGIGITKINSGSVEEGLADLYKARELFEQIGMNNEACTVDSMIAETLWDQKKPNEAIEIASRAFELISATAFHSATLQLGTLLESFYTETQRFEDGYRILKQVQGIKESVYEKESERALELSRIRMSVQTEREVAQQREAARRQVLHRVLPVHIADRLLNGEHRIAERLPLVGILFADIVGFTSISASQESSVVLQSLELLFQAVGDIITHNRCHPIKTIGDAYMASSGLGTDQTEDDIVRLAACALDIIDLQRRPEFQFYSMRLGMHAGPVVAGVMDGARIAYDLWGDTVNIASRMESSSEPSRLRVTATVAKMLQPHSLFTLSAPETVMVRGRGEMPAYWISRSLLGG